MTSSRFATSYRPASGSVARVPMCLGASVGQSFSQGFVLGLDAGHAALPASLNGLDRDEDPSHPGEGSA